MQPRPSRQKTGASRSDANRVPGSAPSSRNSGQTLRPHPVRIHPPREPACICSTGPRRRACATNTARSLARMPRNRVLSSRALIAFAQFTSHEKVQKFAHALKRHAGMRQHEFCAATGGWLQRPGRPAKDRMVDQRATLDAAVAVRMLAGAESPRERASKRTMLVPIEYHR